MSAADADSLRVRRFSAGDDPDVLLALIAESFGPMVLDPPSGALSETRETILARGADAPVLVAEAGGRIVGCIFCKKREAALYVGRLAVAQAFRRSGVGRRLLDAAAALAEEAGLAHVELRVRIALPENIGFFERRGFRIVGSGAHAGHAAPTYHDMRLAVGA